MIIRPSKLNCANWTGDQPDRPFKRPSSAVYEAVENGERIGCIRIDGGGGDVSVHYTHVRGDHQRRGVATKLYEAAARGACKRFGLPLSSDVDLQTGSRGFWEKQVRKGRAHYDADLERYVLSCPAPASLAAAPEAEVAIRAIEREIAAKPTERAYVFDPDGKLVFKKIGKGKASIKFNEEEVAFFPDRILTHNHPPNNFAIPEGDGFRFYKSGASLSPKDVFVAAKRNMAEVRAVTKVSVNGKPVTMVYRIERPPGGWPPPWKIEDEAEAASTRIKYDLIADQRAGRRTAEEVSTAVMHETWLEVAPKLGLKYDFAALDGAPLPRRRRRR